jgi:putative flippase GtrA
MIALMPRTVKPILRLLADRRIRYLFTGGIAAAVFYGTFAGTWLLLRDQVPYLLVVLFGSIVTALTTYPIYRFAVFNSTGPWLSGFFRFYTVSLWGLGFNFAALPFLVEIVHLHVLIAQAIVILAGPLINYQLHRRWTFRPAQADTATPLQPQVVPSED